jgi:SPP1 gp7 family putative phage head morphogenesis protein
LAARSLTVATLDDAETRAEARARRRKEFRAEQEFARAHNAQMSYGAALRLYAKQIAQIIGFHAEGDPLLVPPEKMTELTEALRRYTAGTLPWARAAAWRMIKEVNRRNLTAWQRYTAEMSYQMRQEILNAPTGEAMVGLLNEQVGLITSLPLDAAQRVHENTLNAISLGSRYPELEGDIREALALAHPDATEEWLNYRATLIARTETARTASVLVQARAVHVGADSYIWKTSGDWKVRPSHRRLNNHEFRWDDPPLSDPPDHHSHPGQIWNCRCVALPILPE